MTKTRFGRVVELVREGADAGRSFSIGLEALEPGTGRLVADPVTNYEGSGVAFQAGDLLFGKLRPYLAKAWLSDRDGAAVGDFHVYRPTDGACPGYLRWVLLARSFLDPVESSVFGAKMPRADWEFIRNVEIHVPPEIEQRAIADYLDRETARIDTLIEEQQRLIEMLRERWRAVVLEKVTKGLNPDADVSESGAQWLGEVPSHWAVKALRRCGTLVTGSTPPTGDQGNFVDKGDDRPWVRPQDLSSETQASAWLTPRGWQHLRPVPAGSVLVGCIAYSLGSVGQISEEATTNQQITSIIPKGSGRYLYYVMCAARDELWAASHMNRVPILNNQRLGAVLVPVPSPEEQRLIADHLDAQSERIDQLIAETERFIELSRERRATLITAAVTGQIDVREVA